MTNIRSRLVYKQMYLKYPAYQALNIPSRAFMNNPELCIHNFFSKMA